ncbi:MAG: hypothetical protein ACK5QX_07160, partial [bacterium]
QQHRALSPARRSPRPHASMASLTPPRTRNHRTGNQRSEPCRGSRRMDTMVERCFNKLKHSRQLATRYDKSTSSYLGFVLVVSTRLSIGHFVRTA